MWKYLVVRKRKHLPHFWEVKAQKGFQLFQESTAFAHLCTLIYTLQSTAFLFLQRWMWSQWSQGDTELGSATGCAEAVAVAARSPSGPSRPRRDQFARMKSDTKRPVCALCAILTIGIKILTYISEELEKQWKPANFRMRVWEVKTFDLILTIFWRSNKASSVPLLAKFWLCDSGSCQCWCGGKSVATKNSRQGKLLQLRSFKGFHERHLQDASKAA